MATTPAAKIGANVRAEMARKGITQSSLAVRLGLSQAAVSSRLRGVVAFDVNELHAAAAYLDVPVSSLLSAESAAPAAS